MYKAEGRGTTAVIAEIQQQLLLKSSWLYPAMHWLNYLLSAAIQRSKKYLFL